MRSILLLSALLFFFYVSRTFGEDAKKGAIVRARLEVKAFIREQLPHYHHVNIMYIPGKDPAMVFLDADNKLVLEEDVSEKSLEEIGQFLEKHGMVKSREARSEVPEDPWEGESEELDESWEEEEDGDEGDEPWDEEGTEGPETEEYEEDEGNDATEHTEL